MASTTLWWALAGALAVAEMHTGSFHLLMLAIGAAGGALAAHAGADSGSQLAVAALLASLGLAACQILHRRRRRAVAPGPTGEPAESDADINPDIGAPVQVDAWSADGTARVRYRGAAWAARWADAGVPQPGALVIRAVHGAELQLGRATPPPTSGGAATSSAPTPRP